tara:strand:+ start:2348 stop:2971 length:624 start_codon:yes stop_codon:yes gene_type:complete
MKKNKTGLFLTFEGPEASGKSTQIKLLKNFFLKNNIKFLVTREPGGTLISEKIRNILLNKENIINPTEEILLLMASRLNHINTVIKPALKKNIVVISDRFADSTFVYQGYVNKFGLKESINLHKKILNNFLPYRTFLFLLPSKEIIQRLKKRKKFNKYDKIDINFHKKVISGYKKISKNNKRFININANLSENFIHRKIIKTIDKLI